MNKGLSVSVMFILIVIVLILVFVFFLYKPTVQVKETTTPQKSEAKKLTGLEIAKLSTQFIEKMKRPDGTYTYSLTCQNGICNSDNQNYISTNAWPVYAYVGLYQATNDKSYLEKAEENANILIERCKDLLDCAASSVQINELYKITKAQKYLDFIKKTGDFFLSGGVIPGGVMLTGIESRQQAIVYQLTGDKRYLDHSIVRMEASKEFWKNMTTPDFIYNNFTFYRYSCWTELAELQLYEATKDTKYLDNVKIFFDSADLTLYVGHLGFLTNILPCAEALIKLARITGNNNYVLTVRNILQMVITGMWDSPFDKKFDADYGFSYQGSKVSNAKTVTDTSYMIYLLTRMPNTTFLVGQ